MVGRDIALNFAKILMMLLLTNAVVVLFCVRWGCYALQSGVIGCFFRYCCRLCFFFQGHVMVVGFLSHDKVRKLPSYCNGYKLFYP